MRMRCMYYALPIVLLALAGLVYAGPIAEPVNHAVTSISLAWENPDGIARGRLYIGKAPGVYDRYVDTGGESAQVTLDGPGDYYFAVTSLSDEGVESAFSTELHWPGSRPDAPTGLKRIVTIRVEVGE